ncbi:MAG: AraC family transcriptional regulator, partial [Cyclobacteriaceae bacterium]|nr:AraC family transcriptional regulator [Cyclobacteriaceae bacterium]
SRKSIEATAHRLFPNGYSGIFFNFGNLGKLAIKEEFKTPEISIFGQIDQSFEAIHWPGSYSLGVLLHPTALSKLIKEDMTDFTNKAFDGQLIRKDFKSLRSQLDEVPAVKNKIALLNRCFAAAFLHVPQAATIADAALYLLQQQSSALSIQKLAHHLGISARYLETQFKKAVGISPKTYSLIIRFKRMEQQLHSSRSASWQRLDALHEYHDQNHFIKDFKRFTAHTPSDYLLNNLEMGRSYLVR